jgi:hypothetical protein
MALRDTLDLLVSTATAVGVLLACRQLALTRSQAVSAFEDALAREYRQIVHSLPIEALLSEELADAWLEDHLKDFYRYIDLTNEQIFLRAEGRISLSTWNNWADGIRANMARPAFRSAWQAIASGSPSSFASLRRLEESGFKADPRSWR